MLTTCFRRVAAPLCLNAAGLVSARCPGSVCRLAPALWRIGQAPVAERVRLTRPQVSLSWFFRLKWTDVRAACWSGLVPGHARGTVLVSRGGLERSAGGFLSPLTPRADRGLCSRKTDEEPDSSAAADREEPGVVPGHGLFKFKELVSPELVGSKFEPVLFGLVGSQGTTKTKTTGGFFF